MKIYYFFMCKNLNQLDWKTPDDFLNGQNLVDFIKTSKFNIHQTKNWAEIYYLNVY